MCEGGGTWWGPNTDGDDWPSHPPHNSAPRPGRPYDRKNGQVAGAHYQGKQNYKFLSIWYYFAFLVTFWGGGYQRVGHYRYLRDAGFKSRFLALYYLRGKPSLRICVVDPDPIRPGTSWPGRIRHYCAGSRSGSYLFWQENLYDFLQIFLHNGPIRL